MSDLTGKTILLTGASKGIGAETAKILGANGAHLIAHYGSDRAGAESATAAIPAERKRLIAADLGDRGAASRLWREAVAWRGRVDVLVNNAAVFLWGGGIFNEEADWDRVWDKTLQVNVLAPARLMRNAVRHFRETGGGIIVTISSWAAQRGPGNPETLAYAASKAAIRNVTQTIARHHAKENILAYVVTPGTVRTEMSVAYAATVPGGEAAVNATLAMGEWIPPAELGELVAFLATDTVRHLTGATLDINGASYIR